MSETQPDEPGHAERDADETTPQTGGGVQPDADADEGEQAEQDTEQE